MNLTPLLMHWSYISFALNHRHITSPIWSVELTLGSWVCLSTPSVCLMWCTQHCSHSHGIDLPMEESAVEFHKVAVTIGHVTLASITGSTILVPYFKVRSVTHLKIGRPLMEATGANLELSCRHLTSWKKTFFTEMQWTLFMMQSSIIRCLLQHSKGDL